MHKFLYKFFTGYGFAFFVMAVIGVNALFMIVAQTNISGAVISSAMADNANAQQFENCAKEPTISAKLNCIEPVGQLAWAYTYFKPITDKPPQLDYVQSLLRLQGLKFDKSHNLEILQKMEALDINSPEFISLFENAMKWAEIQKEHSGEELYLLSKTYPEKIQQENLKGFFRHAFLFLSINKGYSPAYEELDKEFE